MNDRLNLLFLSVDCLRADRMSVYGYDRPTTPNIDALRGESLVFENAYSLATFTRSATLQMFTSTRPLSFGGIDNGAIGRPPTLFHQFRNAGYRNVGYSTAHWISPYYGYDCFDEENLLFTLQTIPGMALASMNGTLALYAKGEISIDDAVARIDPLMEKFFTMVTDYCAHQSARLSDYRSYFGNSILVESRFDFDRVMAVAEKHKREFAADKPAYLKKHLAHIPSSFEWISKEWAYCRRPLDMARIGFSKIADKVIHRLSQERSRRRSYKQTMYPDAHAIALRVEKSLEDLQGSEPFLLWAHFKDTHRPFVAGHGPRWMDECAEHLDALGYDRRIDPTLAHIPKGPRNEAEGHAYAAIYDASIHFVDAAIGRIVAKLDALGLGHNTLVVICGDHGEELLEHGSIGHQCLPYEHNVHVPMMFRRQGQPARSVTKRVTHLDLAPTTAAMCGIDPNEGWQGRPVLTDDDAATDDIVFETFCRGESDFVNRPLYFGIRSDRYKYIFREWRDLIDENRSDGNELYDLLNDPGETRNIYSADHAAVATFNALIAKRMLQLPEIEDARIARAFGQETLDAARASEPVN